MDHEAMRDFLILVAGGGIAVLSAVLTQLLIWVREKDSRQAAVRDAAYREGVEACAEFVGASHLHLSRFYDVIEALARIKAKYPHEEYLAPRLDAEMQRAILHPAIEQRIKAAVRAEVLVEKDVMAECIQRMQRVDLQVAVLVSQGNHGKLPADWKKRLERLKADHDRDSTELVERLRELGATTTYRQLS
jgi:hypothetical protein